MTIGYVIIAHCDPALLQRLIDIIRAESAGPIVAHLDQKSARQFASLRAHFSDEPNVRFISTRRVSWGDFHAVQATLDACALLLGTWPETTHVQHLSGQQYPIRPLREFEQWTAALGEKSAMDVHPVPYDGWDQNNGLDRVEKIWIVRNRRRSVSLPFRRAVPASLSLHGGSAFWCLSRKHLRQVLSSRVEYAKIFSWSLLPDEIYVHTAVHSANPETEVVNYPLTYMHWGHRAPSPTLLTDDYLPQMRQSPSFFARKFDSEISRSVLDKLDQDRRQALQADAG